LLVVPQEVSLCTTFSEDRTWEQEYAMLGQIDLRPGQMVLTREDGFQSAYLVERILFGADCREVAITSGGEFEVSLVGVTSPQWRFLYRQEFMLDDRPYRLEMILWVRSEDGVWPNEITLDTDFLSPGMWQSNLSAQSYIGPGEDYLTERQPFDNCYPPDSCGHFIDVETERGNALTLDVRCCAVGFYAGETGCKFFWGLEATLDQGSTTLVGEPFRLIYSARHHNEAEVFAVILDQPLGQAAVLLISRESVIQLDSGFLEIDSEMVTRFNIRRF